MIIINSFLVRRFTIDFYLNTYINHFAIASMIEWEVFLNCSIFLGCGIACIACYYPVRLNFDFSCRSTRLSKRWYLKHHYFQKILQNYLKLLTAKCTRLFSPLLHHSYISDLTLSFHFSKL